MRTNAMKAATATCMPRLVRGRCRASAATARPAGPASLLERIRDVVLRLIMLTAVSKAASSVQPQRSSSGGCNSKASSPRFGRRSREPDLPAPVTCRREDSIRNEAIEDCIEFLKRSSAEGDTVKLSSVTAETVAAATVEEGQVPTKKVVALADTRTSEVVTGRMNYGVENLAKKGESFSSV